MTMNPAATASIYSNTAGTAGIAGKSTGTANGPAALEGAGSFSNLVTQALDNVSENGQSVEARARDLVGGNADIVDLVTAVAETELALETLVTVRDRVISAYQDILNMPI